MVYNVFRPRIYRPGRSRYGLLGAILLAMAIAACGASGPSSAAGTGSGDTLALALAFANCMRSHGVANFPDPGAPIPSGISKQSPVFRSAMQTCNRLRLGGRSTGKPLTGSQRIAALAQVRCVRDHGMPNFPDPTFPSSGGQLFPAIPGFDPESPAFKRAAAACGLRGPVGQPRGG
jgi:predicted small lipoprotein YifL